MESSLKNKESAFSKPIKNFLKTSNPKAIDIGKAPTADETLNLPPI